MRELFRSPANKLVVTETRLTLDDGLFPVVVGPPELGVHDEHAGSLHGRTAAVAQLEVNLIRLSNNPAAG